MMIRVGRIWSACVGRVVRSARTAGAWDRPGKSGARTIIAANLAVSFTVAFGTPMEGTHLPMRTWFTAISLLAVSSKGLSSVALARHLGIGQKTAWFLGQRIRAMMADDSGMLRGVVEADETYVGGRRKRGKASKRDDDDQPKGCGGSRKAMVLTAVERGGTDSELSIAGFLHANVALDAILATDELPA